MRNLLPRGHTALSMDDRPITTIVWPNNVQNPHFRVGQSGVTEIVAYDENGSMSHVPWLAVFKGDDLVLRTPADQVCVSYT